MLKQVEQALADHELVKARVDADSPDDRFAAADALGALPGVNVVQVLGGAILIYKRHPKHPRYEGKKGGSEGKAKGAIQAEVEVVKPLASAVRYNPRPCRSAPRKRSSFTTASATTRGTSSTARRARAPMSYLHGEGNIVPGLEKALEGKQAGDDVKATVPPAEGYGVRNEESVFNVPRRKLPEGKIEPGMTLQLRTEQGPVMATVKAIKGDYVTIDANHPLADMTLHFEVKVVDVRDATAEELEHGHIHGPGGHH